MIIKANLERKPSTLETATCNIVGVEQVALEEFLALKNKPLDDYPFIQKWADAMGTGESGEQNCLLVLNDENDDGIVVNSSGYSYARYAAFVPGAKNTYLMELYPAMQDAVHDLVALVEEYSNMAVERQCDGAFRRNYQEVNAHHAFRNHTDQLFVKMMSTRPEISFAEYDGVTYYFEIAPEYRLEEEHSECRILNRMFHQEYNRLGTRRSHIKFRKETEARSRSEWQADALASALLMPKVLIQETLVRFGLGERIEMLNRLYRPKIYQQFSEMSEYLGVSKQALSIRLSQLGYLDRQKNYLANPYELLQVYCDDRECQLI